MVLYIITLAVELMIVEALIVKVMIVEVILVVKGNTMTLSTSLLPEV